MDAGRVRMVRTFFLRRRARRIVKLVTMFSRLKDIESRYRDLEQLLSDPAIVGKQGVYQKYAKEHSDLNCLVETFREYEKTNLRIEEDQALLRESDEELKEIAREELPQLEGVPGIPGGQIEDPSAAPGPERREERLPRDPGRHGGMRRGSLWKTFSGCTPVSRRPPAGRSK